MDGARISIEVMLDFCCGDDNLDTHVNFKICGNALWSSRNEFQKPKIKKEKEFFRKQ